MRRAIAIVALVLFGVTACGTDEPTEEEKCVAEGKMVVVADPTDQIYDTFMIGCVSVEQYRQFFSEWYSQHTEISDD